MGPLIDIIPKQLCCAGDEELTLSLCWACDEGGCWAAAFVAFEQGCVGCASSCDLVLPDCRTASTAIRAPLEPDPRSRRTEACQLSGTRLHSSASHCAASRRWTMDRWRISPASGCFGAISGRHLRPWPEAAPARVRLALRYSAPLRASRRRAHRADARR